MHRKEPDKQGSMVREPLGPSIEPTEEWGRDVVILSPPKGEFHEDR